MKFPIAPVIAGVALAAVALVAAATDQPDGLTLPPGFHATVVAEGLGAIRHLAVRDNGDIYVSTPKDASGKGGGIIALRQGPNHQAAQVEHFGTIDGGTGIRIYKSALYAASPSGVYRFTFAGDALVPAGDPVAIVQGTPETHPGFARANRPIAFDNKGNLFLGLEASANLCAGPTTNPNAAPVGLKPCPDLGTRAGVWRFSADKVGQRFPTDGEQWATGIRDISSLDWSPADGHLYGIMHGRDNSHRFWPDIVSADDDEHIADEMHRIVKRTDFGWPYTYYDGVRNLRLVAPEYGGDGKTAASGHYSTPALTFHSRRAAPVDLMFYSGRMLPKTYQGGAFIVLHGTANKSGYDVMFVPFDRNGKAGSPTVFADGFSGFDAADAAAPRRAVYRPIGIAEGPDGALYVGDSQKGRVWRIAYGAATSH